MSKVDNNGKSLVSRTGHRLITAACITVLLLLVGSVGTSWLFHSSANESRDLRAQQLKRSDIASEGVTFSTGSSQPKPAPSWSDLFGTTPLALAHYQAAPVSDASPDSVVNINFDDLPAFGPRWPEITTSTPVTTQYPPAIFSGTCSYCAPLAWDYYGIPGSTINYLGSSSPNVLSIGDFVVINFTKPISNFKFSMVGVAENRQQIGGVNIYQNGSFAITKYVDGHGTPRVPIVVTSASSYTDVTKVEIFKGLFTWSIFLDDISFTVPPSPTPTPTPTPTPAPSPPTNLKVTPDEEELSLTWTPSQGAGWYVVERSESQPSGGGSSAPEVTGLAPIDPHFFCNSTVPCLLIDRQLDSRVTYTYVVSAANNSGTGNRSVPASGKPLPKSACSAPSVPTPTPQHTGGHVSWSMNYAVSDRDGLIISDIFLNDRKMAASMSVPYFRIGAYTEGENPIVTRGELRPDGGNADSPIRSRLIDFQKSDLLGNLFRSFKATYAIDHIPGAPKACLTITQKYAFFEIGFRSPADWPGPCEPSETIEDCNKFRPMIQYSFKGGEKEHLRFLNIPQRLHFELTPSRFGRYSAGNTVGVFRDRDSQRNAFRNLNGFEDIRNPLIKEIWFQAIVDGKKPNIVYPPLDQRAPPNSPISFDNFHQTWKSRVQEPSHSDLFRPWFIAPGCPECVHMHWRWGAFFPYQPFGAGYPLLPPKPASGNNQALDIQVVRWKPGEEHPIDYAALRNPEPNNERLFNPVHPNPADGVVLWYSSTGFRPDDTFFWHTAWFLARDRDRSNATNAISGKAGPNSVSQDGPVSINLGDVFTDGENHVEDYDLSTLPSLPAGYVALNNTAYRITTDAEASGPYTIGFSVSSIQDQGVFDNLRIFHAEPDDFDPDNPVWVDVTLRPPDSPAPDFNSRTLSSLSEELGVYVIAKLVEVVPPSGDVANLTVTSADSVDPIMAGSSLTYTISITNNGPQTAHEVMLRDTLSPRVSYVSASGSQGTCKGIEGVIYCALGSINVGGSASVTLVVRPTDGAFPPGENTIANGVSVRAKETDSNPNDNSVDEITTVVANPNSPPSVSLSSQLNGALLVGPASIQIVATATDSDGTISRVEFYDNGEFLGEGASTGGNAYSLSANNLSFGPHSLIALAIDNGGRQSISDSANFLVNGLATISIVSPASQSLFSPGSSLTISARSSYPQGTISKVEFFQSTVSLGTGVPLGGDRYDLVLNNITGGIYSLVAVATDSSNITTTSAPVVIRVGAPPTVSITSPAEGTIFPSSTNISISASALASGGSVEKVDFYSEGALIGTVMDAGIGRFTLTWRQVPDGVHSLTAIATDTLGLSSTSTAINIGVNTPEMPTGEFALFDDALPPGATPESSGGDGWYWVSANPAAISGSKSHQSVAGAGFHQHSFSGATQKLPIDEGDKLVTYLFLDQDHMPREVMLQWNDGNSWEHRAYWGANRINLGLNGTASRFYMGVLPVARRWVRLEIPASQVGLVGKTISGMAFTLDGGRATWDRTGKVIGGTPLQPDEVDGNLPGGISSMVPGNPPEPPEQLETAGDFIWFDTTLPAGAHEDLSFDDIWNRVTDNPCPQCGPLAHRSNLGEEARLHRHSFSGASTPMVVDPGDILFTHVYINPNAKPDEIILQWNDGNSGLHRAYWGNNFLANLPIYNIGGTGTETLRYMGGLPAAGQWVRLEIPASYVGLEGKKVSGMSFGFYRDHGSSQVTWACAGKAKLPVTIPAPLHASLNLYQFFNSSLGYYYATNDIGRSDQGPAQLFAYVFPNAAAGTVPIYRLRNSSSRYLFTTAPEAADQHVWTNEGVAFHIYPRSFGNESAVASGGEAVPAIPGTLPLYLYRENAHDFYFFVTHRLAITGVTFSNVMGYVYPDLGPSVLLRGQSVTPLEDPRSFVQQQYRDFLAREPDPSGWNFWTSNILGCGNDATCVHLRRVEISQEYYQSDEFQNSGYFVYRLYQASYNRRPNFSEFMPDRSTVVGGADLELSKVAFVENWLARPAFQQMYPDSLTPGQFVDNLNANTGGSLSPAERNALVQGLLNQTETRATALRKIADNAAFKSREYNKAFVVMQYFGYLRRNPDQGGLDFWLDVINNRDPNNYFGMVCAFVTSAEYQLRFGPAVTRTDQDCMTTSVGAPPPQVTITSPESGIVFTGPAEISIDASASNADGSIAKVEFLQGGTKIGEDNAAPYSLSWTNVQPGNYQVTAKATDSLGSAVMSVPVNIIVNSPPAATITSPLNGQVFPATSTVSLSASATDPDGTLAKVEFYAGATLIGTDSTAPYTISWNNVSSGAYSLTAKATDNLGATTTSAGVNVIVNSPPSVSVSMPANNAIFASPANITINANASDPDGTISQVQFYQGTTLIGTANSAPFTFTWNNVSSGTYSLTAKATDNAGATTISSAVSVTVNSAPSVNITMPANNAIFTSPANITINANASDSDGTISQVQFYQGSTLIGTANSAPFTFTWNNVSSGTYSLTAKATDNRTATTTSATVTVIVNSAPTISITSPANNSTFTPPTSIAINVSVADLDGSINKVEFFDGPLKIGENLGAPFNFSWAVVPAGNHSLTARVTDNLSATATSGVVVINVLPPPAGKITFTSNRDGNDEIYSMNLDGSNPVRLTNNVAIDSYSRWSPDGSKIVFASERDGNSEIYVMNADGTNQTRLTSNVSFDGYPSWSPDGGKIAFAGDRDGNREIYVMNADGSAQVRLTNNAATDSVAMWSPNGTKLAFHSNRDGGLMEVYVMNGDGSGQTRLTNNPATDFTPAWSADGSKIFFISDRDGNSEIYTMNADGSGQANLTNNSAWDAGSATCSPDGSKVIFVSNRDGNDEVYQMNADGSNQMRLTNNPARERFPAWQPGGIRTNVALATNGGLAIASSSYNSGYAPSGANNGDRKGSSWGNGGGWNDATADTYPDWVQIDFAGSKVIDELDVFTVQDSYSDPLEPTLSMTFSSYGLIGYDIQYWDGFTWIPLPGGSVTGNNKVWRKFSFPALSTSKIRILTNAALADYSRITEVEAWTPAAPGGQTTTYQASTNFASTQGEQNWYYLDSTGVQMSFNPGGNYWQGPESFLWLWANGGHPGPNSDAVRQWRVPQSGTIRITGNVSDANTTCGDGVVVSIKKGAGVLWQQTIENGNTSGFSYDLTTSVLAGDQINFVINNRTGNNYCDGTNFDPTITLTSGGGSNGGQ